MWNKLYDYTMVVLKFFTVQRTFHTRILVRIGMTALLHLLSVPGPVMFLRHFHGSKIEAHSETSLGGRIPGDCELTRRIPLPFKGLDQVWQVLL